MPRSPCPSGQTRDKISKRCRDKKKPGRPKKSSSRKSPRKSPRKSTKKSPKKSPWQKAVEDNLKYYSDRNAGKINDAVRSYLKKSNQSYDLTVDLLDIASAIALREHGRKTVTMRDIKIAKTVDSLLQQKFP